ncbi:S-adenosylmethionine-dependent methyltransferase [Candidatus Kinetoplastibacterium blastocrithidii TCC012E]|uniref:Ribosomal RNA small subunit methyltransferase I n=1 Tax=Candidatus Kinetoplastidibacterium blastocrithidiae TCC012E TaxID=1208922 RepID=M1M4R8_9PROT|nr:16S rRNA (cytidine(1402)-2'-O)-methyltransferase [Candidatus Kinetoplastibacterium blastocrithidii]AFZ83263.1 16S rRNA (cytidine1402-2'-O)-methyltransferase [Candidatus Kinetoplastibacterium blastocrithidii (ex Strigomonas culicis)]AGF50079.1 S-adenosylmethionine-dependent methyltransferase [Candidatus Kinetoplastibacterium blastocrithidii TCC012E]
MDKIDFLKKIDLKSAIRQISMQDWPLSTLYVVATPIGNLADISFRAIYSLSMVDLIAAEDTRVSYHLLGFYGIENKLISAHRHNELEASDKICEFLRSGKRVALISDAGTPGISDPGSKIILKVRSSGYRVIPIPGASSVTTALMASGVTTDENPAYVFAGFVPSKQSQRFLWFKEWSDKTFPVIMLESSHRIMSSLEDLRKTCGNDRFLTIAKELTKKFEKIDTISLGEVSMLKSCNSHYFKGEFVLILHGKESKVLETFKSVNIDSFINVLLDSMPLSESVRVVSKTTGMSRKFLYNRAIMIKNKDILL